MTINNLLEVILSYNYNVDEINKIQKAYQLADLLHSGQMRESGEPYISHPLAVAYILAEMHADSDTIAAALLHDTIEDTDITKEQLATKFNSDVANLVDGVSKISKMNFSTKEEQNMANTRKIITGIVTDVRIIIIKLADRLHNMRTLDFKNEYKQRENSLETMEIFAPLAYYIGAYRIKSELEDISLKYLKPNEYRDIEKRLLSVHDTSDDCLNDMSNKISRMLEEENIPNEIKIRTKNIYGVYKRLERGAKLSEIHDLLSLKVMVNNISNCYHTLGLVHQKYRLINDNFKDYISIPKPNMYQSLHTTVFGEGNKLVQTQIRTFEMDKIASFGLTAYWDINKGNARDVMQEKLKSKYQFFKSLIEIDKMFGDNQDFVRQVKAELFTDKIYVYGLNGKVRELPKGSIPLDFAYSVSTKLGNDMLAAEVNDNYVPFDYELQNKDRVRIITSREELADKVKTTKAKKMIKNNN